MQKVRKFLTSQWVLFTVALLVAGTLRLLVMQYVEFKGDEALNLFLATRPLFHHPFPPAGVTSSAGILNFPLINYLLFPIVIFTLYPPTISFVIALMNVFTVGGFFLLFSRYHGKLTGFFASMMIAVSPWMILYSRKIWEQDFLLPLSLPFFLSMYKILEGEKQYWILFGITSMLLLQIHQLAILIPLLVFFCLIFKKGRPQIKNLLLGIFIGLLPTIPYFWYAISTGFANFHPTTSLFARLSFHSIDSFLRPLQIISISNFHTEMGNDFAQFANRFHLIYVLSKVSYLTYLFLPLSAAVFWVKNNTYRFFVTICILYIIVFFILGIEPLMHYYILLVPFIAVVIAHFFALLIKKRNFAVISVVLATCYLLSLILFDYGFLKFLSEKGGFAGDYGAGYVESAKGANTAMTKFKNYPNYKELYLYSFLPIEYFHGYMPIGKMIYPYNQLQQNKLARENQFSKTPDNPQLMFEVFAYYTQSQDPSWDYVVSLKEKSLIHPVYSFIYQKVLGEYLDKHLKRLYETPDFLLLYPQHWSETKTDDGVVLSDGSVTVNIQQQKNQTPNSILLRLHYYTFSLIVNGKSDDNKLQEYGKETFKEIKESIQMVN